MANTETHRCGWCHGVKAHADVVFFDDVPICKEGGCYEKHLKRTAPVPRSRANSFAAEVRATTTSNDVGAGDSHDWLHGGHGD